LQAAINAAAQGKDKDAHIPTREVIVSDIQYAKLYPPIFSQPATYIRFSSTVEDCCGCPYNMNEEDDAWLRNYNSKRDASSQCSEDDFEATMNFFEETAQAKQPFAAVDSPPVLSFADMAESMDAAVEESVKRFAKDIYEHWKARRLTTENLPLEPMLKVSRVHPCIQAGTVPKQVIAYTDLFFQFETGQDTDDSDPFVCFRRREVRQIRKTRGRDAQSAEKLRRLRKELEEARQLVALVRQREIARKEMLGMDRTLFTQRNEVKEMKRKLNIKDDDEDLINQKVSTTTSSIARCTYTDLSHSPRRRRSRCLLGNPMRPSSVCLSSLVSKVQRICNYSRTSSPRRKTKFFAISRPTLPSISSGTRVLWIIPARHSPHPPKGHSTLLRSVLHSQHNCPRLHHHSLRVMCWTPH
jgi:enhancer of polycomb-like protein